ncbi:hypothetical protein [Streptomyces millisiae]|uniref:GntR family transcriptional regulator n=1 Tax=Streptomyces millisiae TaxID=3075542 RepID=A0ABU2LW13_9ACTN|nr:hypothetical protein [Streptomyces sp. DSM 44918]MDT0321784.1 hypothetical protein [Streptomyces sp. DSM 44918]
MSVDPETAYPSLPEDAARLYSGLGVHPTGDFHRDLVERLGGSGVPERARAAIEPLVRAGLLEATGPDRYHMAPAVWRHARTVPGWREDALSGIAGWYLRRLAAVDLLVVDRPRWGRAFRLREVIDHGFEGPEQALAAMDADRDNVPRVVELLHAEGRYGYVYQLAEAMHGYYVRRRLHDEWISCLHTAVTAAEAAGSGTALARMHLELAAAHLDRSGPDDRGAARRHYTLAGETARALVPPHQPTVDAAEAGLASLTATS